MLSAATHVTLLYSHKLLFAAAVQPFGDGARVHSLHGEKLIKAGGWIGALVLSGSVDVISIGGLISHQWPVRVVGAIN